MEDHFNHSEANFVEASHKSSFGLRMLGGHNSLWIFLWYTNLLLPNTYGMVSYNPFREIQVQFMRALRTFIVPCSVWKHMSMDANLPTNREIYIKTCLFQPLPGMQLQDCPSQSDGWSASINKSGRFKWKYRLSYNPCTKEMSLSSQYVNDIYFVYSRFFNNLSSQLFTIKSLSNHPPFCMMSDHRNPGKWNDPRQKRFELLLPDKPRMMGWENGEATKPWDVHKPCSWKKHLMGGIPMWFGLLGVHGASQWILSSCCRLFFREVWCGWLLIRCKWCYCIFHNAAKHIQIRLKSKRRNIRETWTFGVCSLEILAGSNTTPSTNH